jgi:lipopolysaccharide transport system ATP-binding protein
MARGRQIIQGDQIEEFWALNDVSFQVRRGDVIGIIGPNGAGKSTLLKILSRITEPTRGRVRIKGRVASLLEVGTGFHPELTGRENIFLNGAVLGMKRAEIERKFDEIVAFAEVERFLDTPVKRYSSGMYVRLAFAVAAHLDPEILLVDEVLAVGDAEFQTRCIGKINEQARGGRTIIFITHDMRKATAICSNGILLRSGCVAEQGPMSKIIQSYLSTELHSAATVDLRQRRDRTGTGDAQFQSIALYAGEQESRKIPVGAKFVQRLCVKVNRRIGPIAITSAITTSDGIPVHRFYSTDDGDQWRPDLGELTVAVTIEKLLLYPGTYILDLWLGDRTSARLDYLQNAISFDVVQDGSDFVARDLQRSEGLVLQAARWNFEQPKSTKIAPKHRVMPAPSE